MAADTSIGTRISKRRHVLGLTQQDLAAALGVSKSTVANWETGKHFPRRYLGKVEAVLGLDDDGQQEARPISPRLRREIAGILDDVEDQRRVIGLLEGTLTWPDETQAPEQQEEPGNGDQRRSAG